MKYIQFKIYSNQNNKEQTNLFFRGLEFIIEKLIQAANPDFEKVIDHIREWCLEFNDKEPIQLRDIGIDKNGKVIAKMPYKDNYGYWTDNSLTYDDFLERFETSEITQEYFESKWIEL